MVSAAAVLKQPHLIQKLGRGHAVALNAAVHLGLGLAAMDEEGGLILIQQGLNILHALKPGGILGMQAQHVADIFVDAVELQILPLDIGGVCVKVIERSADNRAEATVQIGPDIVVILIVHVKA